jgi:thiol peroxidase
MSESTHPVTMKGNPVVLTGKKLAVGDSIADCSMVGLDLSVSKLSDFKGKTVILSIVPSLDTPICDLQTQHFLKAIAQMSDDVVVVTVSMDLPFAQKRWCGQVEDMSDRFKVFSDHRLAEVGHATGLLLADMRLLARAVLILDADGVVRYQQVVDEITHEPDYEAVKNALAETQKV